ncbi:MAG: tat (twin-arginine translocation) pathway signal sequence [Pseudomonadota bacterium]
MSTSDLKDRREFLKTGTGLLTGVMISGAPLALLSPGRVWALDLKALSSTEGQALLMMSRTIAPHDKLDDAAYAVVVGALDADAARDPSVLASTRAGIASLGAGFAQASETSRVAALKKIEQTPLFQGVRGKTLQDLYATPMAYALFGFEGEVFSKGGYLNRGFGSLRWLPEVPLEASGPTPGKR